MKQAAFELQYSHNWTELEVILSLLESKNPPSQDQLQQFSSLFRKVCHFHALAIERQYSSYLVDQLEDIVFRAQQQLYRRQTASWLKILRFVALDFPALVRQEYRVLSVASALFLIPLLGLWVGTLISPDLTFSVIDPAKTVAMEEMYNPENHTLGEARESETNWYMFGFYVRNNISVAFRTFATGLFAGVGSIFFLIYNGAYFGVVAGHLTNIAYHTPFFTFVIGHCSFELTAIVIAGAAGLKIGYAIISPSPYSRLESLKRAASVSIKLIYGVIIMLIIAAFIEAFWSSNNLFPPWIKYSVGGALWLLVVGYLCFAGRQRNHQTMAEKST